ncbi:SGNH/GDSL hydrolase family protein [Actinocrispum wychmicini]|uniref:Acyl-CoA thioesterase-1 n=1 Tax=Actinocrispum wychmicini TaxID=1213861 RepID=A0A4R2JMA5_9PSEU|nr:GDSL-type esterase/lipase family protein [Actinocrispum wychmicini]TCO59742.1 acyl-CoA thioesterase-1 [Actinocrispum wychmicini]
MTAALTARLVRFQRPDRSMPYLQGLDEARIAALFGLTLDEYQALLSDFADQVRQAAEDLLGEPDFANAVDRLPDSRHIVALGESTTADRLSWVEILRQVLAVHRPDVRVTNLGVSGSTTTQALAQVPALGFLRPDWVLCMLGSNDAQLLSPAGPTLVSRDETERNLRTLRDLAGPVAWTWLTPSAVDEERVRAYPHFQRAGIGWTNKDIDATAEFLRALPDPTVDTRFGGHPEFLLEDGVHLTLDGHKAVVRAFVSA